MEKEIVEIADKHMHSSMHLLENELLKIRAGRPTPALFESIMVDYHGTPTPLNQMATIRIPDSRQVIIQPWDASALSEIEKALRSSDLSLNPSNDGKLIRISVPPLSTERRQDYVKLVHQAGEHARVSVRNVRRDANDKIKRLKKQSDISEDVEHKVLNDIQHKTDECIKRIDELQQKKEREILE